MKQENTPRQKVRRAHVEAALQRAGRAPEIAIDDLIPPAPTRPLTKAQWIDRAVVQHDMVTSATKRRDEAFIRAVASGATCEEIGAALGGRLTAERVRQVLKKAGVGPRATRGMKKGQTTRLPRNSELAHIDVTTTKFRDPRSK